MLNIVIPMAGAGSRFAQAGFVDPKPLIQILGMPMIELVTRNLTPSQEHRFIYICQESHLNQYPLKELLETSSPNCHIVPINGLTEGAACTVLKAEHLIDSSNPLMIANSDQFINWSIDNYLKKGEELNADGFIMVMPADHPKWSYVKRNDQGKVIAVVEKTVVSNEATTGVYNFNQGADFVKYAKQMIAQDIRVNNEFYVAPVYTEMIKNGNARIETVNVGEAMHGLGTPEDLAKFLDWQCAEACSSK